MDVLGALIRLHGFEIARLSFWCGAGRNRCYAREGKVTMNAETYRIEKDGKFIDGCGYSTFGRACWAWSEMPDTQVKVF